jgi:hypothetical protein
MEATADGPPRRAVDALGPAEVERPRQPPRTLACGECVEERLGVCQRRAQYDFAVFDVLRLHGQDVTARPLSERRALLEELFATIPAAGVLALGMHTRDEAEARARP